MTSTTKKKFVEKELSEDYSLPSESQVILKIVGPKGNNLHQVANITGEEFLASMPTKFRKTIWVKRGDYVVAEEIPEGQKVKYEIVRILQKGQIKFYCEEKIWPSEFLLANNKYYGEKEKSDSEDELNSDDDYEDDEGGRGEFIICNPNKHNIYVASEESSSEEEEDPCGSDKIS